MRDTIEKYMWSMINYYIEDDLSVDIISLVEDTVIHFECEEWLRDPEHWIWELAEYIAEDF